jgi:hypothetical protein
MHPDLFEARRGANKATMEDMGSGNPAESLS